MFLVFLGPPGAGKGTQSRRLLEYLKIPHLSTGDLLRRACADKTPIGVQAQSYMEAGELVPDDLIIGIVEQRLQQPDCAQGCLFDGFPRTLVQAHALDELLDRRGTPLDVVLELQVSDAELERRLASRARADDKPEVIRQRFKAYKESIQSLLEYYSQRGVLRTIEGQGSPDEVFERIRDALPKQKVRQ